MDYTQKWLEKLNIVDRKNIEIYNAWSNEAVLYEIVDDLLNISSDFEYDSIAGIATNGIVYASAIAYKMKKRLVLLRKLDSIRFTKDKLRMDFTNWRNESDGIEIDTITIGKDHSYLVVDDFVQYGESLSAASRLIEDTKNRIVGFVCLANISIYDTIDEIPIRSLIRVKY